MEQANTYQYRMGADTGNLRLAFLLNLVFCIVELFGGVFTNSIAILADALHDLGDALTLGLALYFQKISKKDCDCNFSYGYSRFSTLGSFFNGILLLVGSVFVLYVAISRIATPVMPNTHGVMVFSLLGLIINGSAVMAVRRSGEPVDASIRLHLLEDVWGWLVVLIGCLLMMIYQWAIIDVIIALGISGFTLYNAFGMLSSTTRIMLQGVPSELKHAEIKSHLLQHPNVSHVSDLHVWSIDGHSHVLTAKIISKGLSTQVEIITMRNHMKAQLEQLNIYQSTIEVELDSMPVYHNPD